MNTYLQNLATLRVQGHQALDAAAQVATGQTFLTAELSKLDPRVRLPLENYTYFRDIPLDLGGGWIDTHIARNVDIRGPQDNSTGTNSNDIRVIEYNTSQDTWPVYPYQSMIRISLLETLKMAQTNRSPQDILDKGVRIDWAKTLDKRTYQGTLGYPGLTNNTAVTNGALPNTGTSNTTTWSTKTPANILADFNYMATQIWNASGNAPDAMPNRFLIPPAQYSIITQPMVLGGVGGFASILEYVKANAFSRAFGVVPEIYPLPFWLDGAGTSGTQLIVAYKYDVDCLSLGIPVDLMRFGGPLSVVAGAYEVTYVGNVGVVKINRPQTIQYFYGA